MHAAIALRDLTPISGAAENAARLLPAGDRPLDHLSDAQLVVRARAGERRAFAVLYRRHRRSVLVRLMGLLRDPAAAEDAAHDAFVRAYEHLPELRGEFAPWVHGIATHLALNELRQRATRGRLRGSIDPPALPEAPEEHAAAAEERRRTWDVLNLLAPEQRRVLAMRYLDGLSRTEIAAYTGLDADRVRSLLQNGRRNLRLILQRLSLAAGSEP